VRLVFSCLACASAVTERELFCRRKRFKREIFHGRKLFLMSLQQPQGQIPARPESVPEGESRAASIYITKPKSLPDKIRQAFWFGVLFFKSFFFT
jgi:hypothetical protein